MPSQQIVYVWKGPDPSVDDWKTSSMFFSGFDISDIFGKQWGFTVGSNCFSSGMHKRNIWDECTGLFKCPYYICNRK